MAHSRWQRDKMIIVQHAVKVVTKPKDREMFSDVRVSAHLTHQPDGRTDNKEGNNYQDK
jgi:hypothetical protein